ncbi:hypothetical protein [Micromonospora sp. NPDC047740]|uniref:hypothetical protein n=1 Tax=Micromonospora sp. NPDC047740 TaxID=3364254 RepID=UPI00371C7C93
MVTSPCRGCPARRLPGPAAVSHRPGRARRRPGSAGAELGLLVVTFVGAFLLPRRAREGGAH